MKFYVLPILLCLSIHAISAQTINPENITIVRDQWGLPHIYAKTNPEVGYGVAWVQGEDHFELMQQNFMLAKGLLGRVYGKGGATGDFFAGFLGVKELVEKRMRG